jgi:hypothetical protein
MYEFERVKEQVTRRIDWNSRYMLTWYGQKVVTKKGIIKTRRMRNIVSSVRNLSKSFSATSSNFAGLVHGERDSCTFSFCARGSTDVCEVISKKNIARDMERFGRVEERVTGRIG